jgi:hypothetical protein
MSCSGKKKDFCEIGKRPAGCTNLKKGISIVEKICRRIQKSLIRIAEGLGRASKKREGLEFLFQNSNLLIS